MSDTATKPRGISKGLATRHVSLNLNKSVPGNKYAWQHLSLESVSAFTRQAKAWLKDKSNLSGKTIDAADYAELLEHFRQLAEWKPKAQEKPETPVKIPPQRVPVKLPGQRKPTSAQSAAAPKRVTAVVEETPKRKRSEIPENWLYMAQHANTESARNWWADYCGRWLRGEV